MTNIACVPLLIFLECRPRHLFVLAINLMLSAASTVSSERQAGETRTTQWSINIIYKE
jgi:hypothetical protein